MTDTTLTPAVTAPDRQRTDRRTDQCSAQCTDGQRSDWLTTLTPLVLDAGLPVGAYFVARDAFGTSMITAFIVSSIASLAGMVVTLVRERKVSALSGLILGVNVASIALSFLSGSVRVVAGKDAVISSVIGFGILFSVLRGRPALAEGFRMFITRGRPELDAAWDRLAPTSAAFRRLLGLHSAIFGVAFVLDCAARVVCACVAPVFTLGWIGTAATIGAIAVASVVAGAVTGDPLAELVTAEAAAADTVSRA